MPDPAIRAALEAAGDALRDVAAERRRQIEAEGWSIAHADRHTLGEMADAAACYAIGESRRDVPEITPDECRRHWLTPEETLDVAGMYREAADSSDPARKLFSNMVERGYVVGRKAGTGRTSPRLFSLESAVKAGVMLHMTRVGQSFDTASDIGDATAALLRALSERAVMAGDIIDTPDVQHTVIAHFGIDGRCRAEVVSEPRADIFRIQSINRVACVVFHASYFLDRALERYARRLLAAKEKQQ